LKIKKWIACVIKVEAKFHIVTPMFLGGADQKASSIRPSSVKGAIVFWWRVLNSHKYVGAGNEQIDYRKFKCREKKIFGSDEGQSNMLLRVRHNKLKVISPPRILCEDGVRINREAAYFGYGLMKTDDKNFGKLERSAIRSNQEFSVQILFHNDFDGEAIKEILNAVKAFGMVGGLGARVRKGYGSLALKTISQLNTNDLLYKIPSKTDDYRGAVVNVLNKTHCNKSGSEWDITAFSSESLGKICGGDNNALTALNKFSSKLKSLIRKNPNDRILFGLPRGDETKRRASQVFTHIHKIGDSFHPVILFLPSRFLPNNTNPLNSNISNLINELSGEDIW